MKSINLKAYIFVLSIIILSLLNIFVLGIKAKLFILLALFLIIIIALFIFKYRKEYFYQKKSVIWTMAIIGIIQIVLYYISGLFEGFSNNVVKLNLNNLFTIIIPMVGIIIIIELLRYILSTNYKDKKFQILTIIMFILIDINLFGLSYNLSSLENILEFLGLVLFPSIAINIVFNKIVVRYGYSPLLAYRLIIILAYYLIPVVPNTYVFFRSIFKIMIPIFGYLLIAYMYDRLEFEAIICKNRKGRLFTYFSLILVILFSMLVSCQFRYGAITIGSGSMKNTLDVGDVVIFEAFKDQEINVNDIIIYQNGNKNIVHRVVEIVILNNNYVYITKGDNNKQVDKWYVYDSQIKGISKARIKYIGYPSIWVKTFFEKE